MNCEKARKIMSPLLDRQAGDGERESLSVHLDSCGSCAERWHTLEGLRSELRRMAPPVMPTHLAQQLRMLAARERIRQLTRLTAAARLARWTGRLQLFFDDLMRPFALPFAGGVVSALLVFSVVFLPSFRAQPMGFDPSIELVTLADGYVEGAPGETPGTILRGPALDCDETIVELTIDPNGNIRDWNMVRGQVTGDVKDMIIWSHFIPATYFGRPVQSKVQVALHSIDRDART